jgi:hypothetical protein
MFPCVQVPDQGQGAEYGLPKNQIKGEGGAIRVEVPAAVADRFNAAVERTGGGSDHSPVTDDKHMSGMEPVADRVRNLTEVATAKMQSGGTAETRTPDIGFPARPHVD